jgi:hypothetical protein
MLDGLAPQRDFIGPLVEPLLHAFEDPLVLPPANATLLRLKIEQQFATIYGKRICGANHTATWLSMSSLGKT